MKGADIRTGWSSYKVSGKFEIAFHRGKGRKPRFQFVTNEDLAAVRDRMNEAGAKLGPIEKVSKGVFKCRGKDPEKNMIEVLTEL